MEALLLVSIYLLKQKVKLVATSNKVTTYIYCISNSVNNKKYIGSTTKGNIDIRFAEHNECIINGTQNKFYNFIRDNKASISMDIICTVKIRTYIELLLMEDYWIYKYDAINNGLNSIYNTKIAKIILTKTSNIIKFGFIDNYIDTEVNKMILCSNNYNLIRNKLKCAYKDNKLSSSSNAWLNLNNISVYNPFIVNDNIKVKTSLDMNIVVIYGFVWNNNKTHVCGIRGGINNIVQNSYSHIFSNKLTTKILKYGLDNMTVYPLEYIHSNLTDSNKYDVWRVISKRVHIINSKLKKHINQFIDNKFYLLQFLYNKEQIQSFISKCRNSANVTLYCLSLNQNYNKMIIRTYNMYLGIFNKHNRLIKRKIKKKIRKIAYNRKH